MGRVIVVALVALVPWPDRYFLARFMHAASAGKLKYFLNYEAMHFRELVAAIME